MFVSSKRSMLTSLTAGAILAMLVVNSAFAWDFLGTFVGYQNWSPNSGDKWAQFADDGSWNRYLDAEARYIYYTGSRKAWISQYSGSVAIVFHAFRRDTNCFVNMTGTGYAWSDFPYAGMCQ